MIRSRNAVLYKPKETLCRSAGVQSCVHKLTIGELEPVCLATAALCVILGAWKGRAEGKGWETEGLEDGSDEVAELAGGDDADGEDGEAPDDGEVASAVFGCEDLGVDEANDKVGLLGRWTSARRRREEALLCRAGHANPIRFSSSLSKIRQCQYYQ